MREVETDHGRARIDLVLGRKRFGRESENGSDDDAPAPVIPEMKGVTKSGEAPGGAYRNHWQMRDLPYGWCAFFENAIDPAHAVVSHHHVSRRSVQRSRRFRVCRGTTDD